MHRLPKKCFPEFIRFTPILEYGQSNAPQVGNVAIVFLMSLSEARWSFSFRVFHVHLMVYKLYCFWLVVSVEIGKHLVVLKQG